MSLQTQKNATQNLLASIDKLQKLNSKKAPELSYHQTISAVFNVIHEIYVLEKEGMHRREIRAFLDVPRKIISQSPFFHHAQTWPRGYQGDFEMIEHILGGEKKLEKGTIGYFLEKYAINCPASQQHRNKVACQSQKILEIVHANKICKSRILSIACGSSPDFRMVKNYIDPEAIEIVLLDSDPDAIEFSLRHLKELEDSIATITGNIFRNLFKIKQYGKFDLVVIGGLFDYLNDKLVVKILKNIREYNLKEAGEIFFTNISTDNPDRIFMEYLTDWELIIRTSSGLRQLCCNAGFREANVRISKDITNLTFLAGVKNG